MADDNDIHSDHFTLTELAEGVYACVHKEGGGAFSNAGIIDLGDRTILVDSLDTRAAGGDLRSIAEALFDRPVDTIILTHVHNDHWGGVSVFETSTTLMTTTSIRQEGLRWGKRLQKDYKNQSAWKKKLEKMEAQVQTETDERVRLSLEKSIVRNRFLLAEMADYEPRYADEIFKDKIVLEGSARKVETWDYGKGHSNDDVVLFIPEEKIAFIGDIGFFNQQPFLGFYCDIDLWRGQIQRLLDLDYDILVPGHGSLGNRSHLTQQLKYFDVMENLIGEVVKEGGSQRKAMKINLPHPFDKWLMGGMSRWEVNVRYIFKRMSKKFEQEGTRG